MKRYIIFGAGRYGEEALFYYGIKNVAYFCDNIKYGSTIHGIEIVSFDKLMAIWKDYEIILAVSKAMYRIEMERQLKKSGIEYQVFSSLEMKLAESNFDGEYEFIDRSQSKEKLLMVLSGYKEFLWNSIFSRVRKYASEDMDICVITAGYKNETLAHMCALEGWSYLYTYENKLSLTQNLAIRVHPNAKWIFKMDEDIFITQGVFEELLDTYLLIEKNMQYIPGIVVPLMAVNSYGYRRILEYVDKVADYNERFGPAMFGAGNIFYNKDAAQYMWDITLPVDSFAERLKSIGLKYTICYHRFSIGCLLISRSMWAEMGGFKIGAEGGLGMDEEHLCKWCMNKARAIIVAERAYAGHFAYGPQTEWMKLLYQSRRADFDS